MKTFHQKHLNLLYYSLRGDGYGERYYINEVCNGKVRKLPVVKTQQVHSH